MSIQIEKVRREHMDAVIELLQHMSVFSPPKDTYDDVWASFFAQTNVHSVVAVIDEIVVGYGSVVIETKIRGGKMGHVEDIVSHADYRKRGIGEAVVDSLFNIARVEGCYKVALQCKERNVAFYEGCGYEISGVAMQRFALRD